MGLSNSMFNTFLLYFVQNRFKAFQKWPKAGRKIDKFFEDVAKTFALDKII